MNLQELSELYRSRRPALSDGAYQQMLIAARQFQEFAGDGVPVEALSLDLLAGYMRWLLEQGRSPATVNSKRQSILTLWRHAADMGLAAPPPRLIPRLIVPSRLPVVWTLEEVSQLFACFKGLRGSWQGVPCRLCWPVLVSAIWDTGCRVGEVMRARLAHVDQEKCTWLVPAENIKGGRADRLYRLHADTVALIRLTLPPDRERLIPFPARRRELYRAFGRVLKAAGLPADRRRKFHCLRRTAESYAAAARGVQWAAAAVGHTEAVARKSYINPMVAPGPALVDAVPRPEGP